MQNIHAQLNKYKHAHAEKWAYTSKEVVYTHTNAGSWWSQQICYQMGNHHTTHTHKHTPHTQLLQNGQPHGIREHIAASPAYLCMLTYAHVTERWTQRNKSGNHTSSSGPGGTIIHVNINPPSPARPLISLFLSLSLPLYNIRLIIY